jgi:integration host factor subunit alpha
MLIDISISLIFNDMPIWCIEASMTEKTVTRADLCEAVYQKIGLSRTESAALVELVLKEITECLQRGETVKLSSFGSFVVRKKGQRIGRNPKTGTEVPISPRRVMLFKPSAILKQRINTRPGSSSNRSDGKALGL